MHTTTNYDTFVKENGYCHWKERKETCQAIVIDEVLSQINNCDPKNITDDGMIYCGNLLEDLLKRIPEMPIMPGAKYDRTDRKYFDKESRYEFLNEEGKKAYLLPVLDLLDPKYCNKYNYNNTTAKEYPCIYRNGSCKNYYIDPNFADNYVHLVNMDKVNKVKVNLELTNQVQSNNVVTPEKEVCCFELQNDFNKAMNTQKEKEDAQKTAKYELGEARNRVTELKEQLRQAEELENTAMKALETAGREVEESKLNSAIAVEALSKAYNIHQ